MTGFDFIGMMLLVYIAADELRKACQAGTLYGSISEEEESFPFGR